MPVSCLSRGGKLRSTCDTTSLTFKQNDADEAAYKTLSKDIEKETEKLKKKTRKFFLVTFIEVFLRGP